MGGVFRHGRLGAGSRSGGASQLVFVLVVVGRASGWRVLGTASLSVQLVFDPEVVWESAEYHLSEEGSCWVLSGTLVDPRRRRRWSSLFSFDQSQRCHW